MVGLVVVVVEVAKNNFNSKNINLKLSLFLQGVVELVVIGVVEELVVVGVVEVAKINLNHKNNK